MSRQALLHLHKPFLLLCLFLLVGCGAGQTAVAEPATIVTTTPKPAIIIAVVTDTPAPVEMPAFQAANPDNVSEIATSNAPTPTNTPTSTPPPTNTPIPLNPTETTTPTDPPPTFTPPSLPYTLPDEHYWFRRPVPEGEAVWTDKTYPYGHTRNGQLRTHHGVEFNVNYDTPVLSAASGTVVFAGSDNTTITGPETNFYGNVIVIEHDSRWQGQPVYTLYGHLNQIYVRVGDAVDMQQQIALSGATGVADGPHLHFEVRVGSNSYESTYNPLLWLYPFPDRGVIAGRVLWPDGSLVYQAPVTARRVDASSAYAATTTYADEVVNEDIILGENFALDDIVAGYYEVEINVNGKKYKQEVWVYPYRTAFVEFILEP